MSQTSNVTKFFPIEIDKIKDNTSTHFDIFTACMPGAEPLTPSDYILYARGPYDWNLRELTDLTRVGIHQFYVSQEQKDAYDRYLILQKSIPKVDKSLEPKFRVNNIQDVGRHIVELAFISEISPVLIEEIKTYANDVVDTIMEDPTCLRLLTTLVDHDLYTYIHSASVGCIAPALSYVMGERDKAKLVEYSIGGLLHDVGKKDVPVSVLNKNGPLNAEEWEAMKAHPALGLEATKTLELSKEVREIIELHHEKMDGSGYPFQISGSQIPQHVQIVTVADIYNALTTSRCYHSKRTRFEALMFMRHNLTGKIGAEPFKALVSCLADEKNKK